MNYLGWSPRILSIMRIVTAFLFMAHGSQKLFGFPESMPFPVTLVSQLGIAGILEFYGGILLFIGFGTRLVAFVLCGEMAVAYLIAHAPQELWPLLNGGELALLYCFSFLYFSVSGGGAWSIDELIFAIRKKTMRKLFIQKSIVIDASPEKVWNTLTKREITDQWTHEFSDKESSFHLESDWKLGEPVLWKSDDGTIKVEGSVTAFEPNRLLRFTVYDTGSDKNYPLTEEDGITYHLSEQNGKTVLELLHGDFSVMKKGKKYYRLSSAAWDRVLPKIKTLAEK